MSWFANLPYPIYFFILSIATISCIIGTVKVYNTMFNSIKGKLIFFSSILMTMVGIGIIAIRTITEFNIFLSYKNFIIYLTFALLGISIPILIIIGITNMIKNRDDPAMRLRLKCLGVLMVIILILLIFLAIIWDK